MLQFHAVPEAVRNLLNRLSPLPALHEFALGGGTSLALRLGHRWSVDLDFFNTREFDTDELNPDQEPDPVSLNGDGWPLVKSRMRAMVSDLT